jgi:F-box and WD-40 domain protein CDC4
MAVLTGHTDRIYSLSFDGLLLASGSLDGTTRIWDATSSLCLQTLVSSQAAVTNVVISPTSTVLACGSSDGTVVIYSLVPSDNFRVVQAIAPHQSSITGLQFEDSEQHLILLTSGSDGWIRRFDAVNGKFLREFCDHADTVWKVVACVDVCGVVSQKGGRTVVDVWSTRTPPSMIE